MTTPSLLKRRLSDISLSSSDESDVECLTIAAILDDFDIKYPQQNFGQYKAMLKDQGIIYAESALEFGEEYYVQQGMAAGSVGIFLRGVAKAIKRQIRDKKRAKKENGIGYESQEI